MRAAQHIEARVDFSILRYGSVWEDADVLCDALEPVGPGGRLLSVASAGDNVLALLTLDPEQVVAADLSRAQLAALELRIAALRHLDHAKLLCFLGVTPSANRLGTYRSLRSELAPTTRAFWDARTRELEGGIVHAGRFERYLRGFRQWVLPLIHPRRRVRDLFNRRTRDQREVFYDSVWDNRRWKLLAAAFFGRWALGRFGRDPAFLEHVEGPVGRRLVESTRGAATRLDPLRNPYLTYALTGNYTPEATPRYLRPEWAEQIRSRLDRVQLTLAPIEATASGSFDGFNLSDVFEYMSSVEHVRCYEALIDQARPGARLVYWNLLVGRSRPPGLNDRARSLEDLAERLHQHDRAWFYQALHVDEVTIGGGS